MQDVLSRVQKVFQLAFGVEPQAVTVDTRPNDVEGWDSLGHASLASGLESEFNLSFDVDELLAMESVREIIRIVESKLAQRT
jgi:acyl carrier protein